MVRWSRRRTIVGAAALSAAPLLSEAEKGSRKQKSLNGGVTAEPSILTPATKAPKPLVHVTDLFRPHNDPDDHWDLATGYALAIKGDLSLMGILVDNPVNIEELPKQQKTLDAFVDDHNHVTYKHVARSPDVSAVAQLNYITNRAVPVTAGTIWPTRPGEKIRKDNLPNELRGVNMLLNVLKESAHPVTILVGGSCQDVAIAGKKDPELFAKKCAGIYLNAGVGSRKREEQLLGGYVEWNVSLNCGAYATLFELPCPIYWMPCFNTLGREVAIGEFGSYWYFQQKEILPYLSDHAQAYFSYVLSEESGTNWLSYLLDARSKTAIQRYFDQGRGMYGTAAFLHAAGKVVTRGGDIVPLDAADRNAVWEFIPIEVRCSADGITEWQSTQSKTSRYIFRVKDKDRYGGAMTQALKSTLLVI